MSRVRPGGWRWGNVPVPEPHVGGLLAGGALHLLRPWPLPLEPGLALPVGAVLVAAGAVVVAWAVVAVGRDTVADPTALVTDGPYRYSRNPMYVGWTGAYVGAALAAGTSWPLVLLPLVALAVHRTVRWEERALQKAFGDAFQAYRRRVRRYL